jgi:hypothetical protein
MIDSRGRRNNGGKQAGLCKRLAGAKGRWMVAPAGLSLLLLTTGLVLVSPRTLTSFPSVDDAPAPTPPSSPSSSSVCECHTVEADPDEDCE